jgi:hypothetical protein
MNIEFEGWRVPTNFVSDGCTGVSDGKANKYAPACVLHDFLRRHAIVSKRAADAIFYRNLLNLGAGRIRASLYWIGVRITAPFATRTYKLPPEWAEYAKPIE